MKTYTSLEGSIEATIEELMNEIIAQYKSGNMTGERYADLLEQYTARINGMVKRWNLNQTLREQRKLLWKRKKLKKSGEVADK